MTENTDEERPSDAPRVGRRRWFPLLAVLLPLALFALVEGALRLGEFRHPLDPPPYRFAGPAGGLWSADDDSPMVRDPELFWRVRPGIAAPDGCGRINSRGYRTPEPRIPKPAGVQRIVFVGDSVTLGLGVAPKDAWPTRLADALHALRDDPRIEAVNLGVPGYSSHQGSRLLTTDVAELEPDVVVCFGGVNDWAPARGRTDDEQKGIPWYRTLRVVELTARLAGVDAFRDADLGDDVRLRTMVTREYTEANSGTPRSRPPRPLRSRPALRAEDPVPTPRAARTSGGRRCVRRPRRPLASAHVAPPGHAAALRRSGPALRPERRVPARDADG